MSSQQSWTTAHGDHESFSELSKSLHQTAQPLTALQGWIELAATTPHTEDEYKSLMTHAMQELQRVFACFDRVREISRSLHV